MKKVTTYNISKDNQTTVVSLDVNHIVRVLYLKLQGLEGTGKKVSIAVEYAQNSVLSDLIPFAQLKDVTADDVEVKAITPASASHFFITISDPGVTVADIDVMEEEIGEATRYYPAHVDFDLGENYYLDKLHVFTPAEGYNQYTVFTSMDGRDFQQLAKKMSKEPCDQQEGDLIEAGGKEARIVRVYIEYNSASVEAIVNDLKVDGKKSGTPIQERPEVNVVPFDQSPYNIDITDEDVYEEVYGIIDRKLGEMYRSWFTMQLCENPKGNQYDYFELSSTENESKILIKGNNGGSLAVGLNHYLKYFCQVNISQVGDQTKMPKAIVAVKEPVFKETKATVRYAYNYCALSYSSAFWGEKEWRNEIDWLALNGVNVVLDATAQEEVWRRFLTGLGYTHEEVKKFVAGPAYYAWAYMANMFGFGGPVHDTWFEERTELARKNQLSMRKLGMQPAKQGYSGMVPMDICDHDEKAEIIPQGKWCSFDRPSMLKTTAPVFKEYAQRFYKAQDEVYGTASHYYATDPFHEGGNTGGMSARAIASEVLNGLLKADPEGVWIIQAWQHNPTSELLVGIGDVENGRDHALILDLYAEKTPHYDEGQPGAISHGYDKEFDHTPWVFCMLNNFGGRLGLHGHLDNMANWIPKAYNTCTKMAGIGITPEASGNNPVLYDFLFETIWMDDADKEMQVIDLDSWLKDYSIRRYGAVSESAYQALRIMKDTVYKSELNMLGQGAPESVMNARPALSISAASTWGNAIISYDKKDLRKAAALLLEDYELLKDSEGYIYDVTTILQQVLSNTAQDSYQTMIEAYEKRDLDEFEACAKEYLTIAEDMETVLSSSPYYMLGRWVEAAKDLAKNADDFSKKLYEFNAKALITTWGSFHQAEIGKLHEYSNRQWSGLIKDYYKPRWERFIQARTNELKGLPYETDIQWFEWEWEWVRDNTEYPTVPTKPNLYELGQKILHD